MNTGAGAASSFVLAFIFAGAAGLHADGGRATRKPACPKTNMTALTQNAPAPARVRRLAAPERASSMRPASHANLHLINTRGRLRCARSLRPDLRILYLALFTLHGHIGFPARFHGCRALFPRRPCGADKQLRPPLAGSLHAPGLAARGRYQKKQERIRRVRNAPPRSLCKDIML